MNNKKTLLQKLRWISIVAKRFSRVDRKGRSAVTSRLAADGIAAGVMTLIVVMGIMNGFQMSFIDSIQEISSYHFRVKDESIKSEKEFLDYCNDSKNIIYTTAFLEAQSLVAGPGGEEAAAVLRAVEPSVYIQDEGFNSELRMIQGNFDLKTSGSIILGSSLAKNLGVRLGQKVNLLVLSGSSDVDLFSQDRTFTVTGVFTSGYKEINSNFAFINIEDGYKYFGKNPEKIWGLKIKNVNDDLKVISNMQRKFPQISAESWRSYNKAFFGTLRIEKNILLMLVALIFVVVAINIYNGMRRLVFERKSEIAVFSALGASSSEIKAVFIFKGLTTGLAGALVGLVLGLLISFNTDYVFSFAAKFMYGIQYCITFIFNHENIDFIQENSSFRLYASIPARLYTGEVFLIFLFGFISPVIACWAASKNVLKIPVSEVLHNE